MIRGIICIRSTFQLFFVAPERHRLRLHAANSDLCHKLNDTTSFLDLALCVLAEVSRANDEWDLRDAALAEDLAVAEWEEVDDGCSVRLAAGDVFVALVLGDEGPELRSASQYMIRDALDPATVRKMWTYLVKVDDRLPELILHLVEVSHTHFTEVTGMVLVEIGTVMMLATGHTATTGMLPVLSYTSITGGDVPAAVVKELAYNHESGRCALKSLSLAEEMMDNILLPRLSESCRHRDCCAGAMRLVDGRASN